MSENFEKEKKRERPVFLEELQAARNFSKASLHFNRMTNSLRQVWDIQDKFADTFRNTHFLCATKNCPPEAVGKIDPKVPGKSCDEIWW